PWLILPCLHCSRTARRRGSLPCHDETNPTIPGGYNGSGLTYLVQPTGIICRATQQEHPVQNRFEYTSLHQLIASTEVTTLPQPHSLDMTWWRTGWLRGNYHLSFAGSKRSSSGLCCSYRTRSSRWSSS